VKVEVKERPYRSDLRRQQAAETRRCIIEAVVRVAANGVGSLSIPAVAREAGVSVPTVYRHFGSKDELLEALGAYYGQQLGVTQEPWPSGLEELERHLYSDFERAEQVEPALRAAMLSEAGREARKATVPTRMAMMEHAIGPLLEQFLPGERVHAERILLVIGSSAIQRAFKDYLGLGPKEAADAATWAIRRLLGAEPGRRKR
jgi:AcrR family transcriptional regulator